MGRNRSCVLKSLVSGLLLIGVAGCATPNFFPREHIRISSSGSGDELSQLDILAAKWGFAPASIGRTRAESADGPMEVMRAFRFPERDSLRLYVVYVPRLTAYGLHIVEIGYGGLDLRGLGCRKYLEVIGDVRATFDAERLNVSRETCSTAG